MESLHARHINASISHGDFALLDFKLKGVPWALRLSPHYYNTEEEIMEVVAALKELIH
jgi:selenocysteine lyase/cysteine desulfurase